MVTFWCDNEKQNLVLMVRRKYFGQLHVVVFKIRDGKMITFLIYMTEF